MPHEELEISGGLYAPFQPTTSMSSTEGVCLPRKHLIANQTTMLSDPEEHQLHYPRSWQRRNHRIELDDDDEDFDDDDDDDDVRQQAAANDHLDDNDDGKNSPEEAIAPAEKQQQQQQKQQRASDVNYLENGRKLIQVGIDTYFLYHLTHINHTAYA